MRYNYDSLKDCRRENTRLRYLLKKVYDSYEAYVAREKGYIPDDAYNFMMFHIWKAVGLEIESWRDNE